MSVREFINEVDQSVKSGQPPKLRDFGFKSTTIAELIE
jgi:hypothetical protein